ncbi:MAG: tRNA uracil 4-sulfurtransferase [Candidatus Woesearchaeota archaeon]|nr:tRNA uracil 4-sulfurtransferase [Candidatus Woesearchaeota archaeon]
MNCFIIRYSEIGLKGKNRPYFERSLLSSIKRSLKYFNIEFSKITRIRGRIILHSKDKKADDALKKVFGIASFSEAIECPLKIQEIKKEVFELIKSSKDREIKTFRITTNRLVKNFNMTSQQINEIIGEAVLLRYPELKVSLKNPQLNIGIEISNSKAYVYTKKEKALGGLPISVSGRCIVLLSGGIDSPVAAYQIMRRGCNVHLIHFSHTTSTNKIKKIYEKLKEYNPLLKLSIIPFNNIENQIIKYSPSKYRIIILRIAFIKYIEKHFPNQPIVTGDNLGQVASQTIENLRTISSFSSALILRPLISFDKQQIIEIAKEIGTYELSILPYTDCCNLLVSTHPEIKATPEEIKEIVEKIQL